MIAIVYKMWTHQQFDNKLEYDGQSKGNVFRDLTNSKIINVKRRNIFEIALNQMCALLF